jgi:NADPH:quinone reductase-like Zn-dependent oxidoreductase
MNAVALYDHGGVDKLVSVTNFPVPTVGPDEVLIEVKATAVNRIDLVVRSGYPGIQIPLPHVLGGDIAGVVADVGSNVHGVGLGQRVVTWPLIACGKCALCAEGRENLCLNWKYFGLHRHGGYAQYVSAPAASVLTLPDSVSFKQATALGVAGLTAYHAITSVGQLRRGQSFFIWGGSGGVGTIAIQLAKMVGASVMATAGKDNKLQALKELGADHVFNHYTDDVSAKVRELHPAGVDLIVDYVGPATFPKSFDLLKKGGSMLLCGILTGRETSFSIHQTYLRHLSIKGLYLGTKKEMQELLTLAADQKVKPVIGSVLPLGEAAAAHTMMAQGEHLGKIVLEP